MQAAAAPDAPAHGASQDERADGEQAQHCCPRHLLPQPCDHRAAKSGVNHQQDGALIHNFDLAAELLKCFFCPWPQQMANCKRQEQLHGDFDKSV